MQKYSFCNFVWSKKQIYLKPIHSISSHESAVSKSVTTMKALIDMFMEANVV